MTRTRASSSIKRMKEMRIAPSFPRRSTRRNKSTRTPTNILNLPKELIGDIVRRLPETAISACLECYNKELYKVILSETLHPRSFFTYHPFNSTNNDTLLVEYGEDYSEVVAKYVKLDFIPKPENLSLKVLTSYRCWLLVQIDTKPVPLLRLGNPTTRNCVFLPNDVIEGQVGDSVYGIGRSREGRYKVVRFRKLRDNWDPLELLWYVDVLDLGCTPCNNTSHELKWRKVDSDDLVFGEIRNESVVLNGSLHWPAEREFNSIEWLWEILRFDLDKEEFDLVSTPGKKILSKGTWPDDDWEIESIGSTSGLLCVTVTTNGLDEQSNNERVPYRQEVWVMMKYGVEESWEQMIVMDPKIGRVVRVLEDFRILIREYIPKDRDDAVLKIRRALYVVEHDPEDLRKRPSKKLLKRSRARPFRFRRRRS